jgi:acyl-CoA thioester hydrolase
MRRQGIRRSAERMAAYETSFVAGWGEMDFNAHMGNRAYLDKSGDVRVMFFAEHGFPASEFARLRIGPVILKDTLEYYREIGLLEAFRVSLALCAGAEDGSRFEIRNDFTRHDGKRAARVTSTGAWLDLSRRKLVVPPLELAAAIRAMPRTTPFTVLPSITASSSSSI